MVPSRIVHRPERADPYLLAIFKKYIWNKASMMQKIDRSPDLKSTFEGYCKEACDPEYDAGKAVSAAKHRIETMQNPRGAFVVFLDAVISTAEEIVLKRTGKENQDANDFLATLDEEEYLQCGMMCDGIDDGMVLKAFVDDDNMDVGEMNREVDRFLRKIHSMFVEGNCGAIGGYTSCALRQLRRQRVLHLKGRESRSFGGPRSATKKMIQRCLGRMICWVKLCEEECKAEFPHFSIFSAFSVFDVRCGAKRKTMTNAEQDHHSKASKILRLSQFFKRDPDHLTVEIADIEPASRSFCEQHNCCSRDGWLHSIRTFRKRSSMIRAHPSQNVKPIVKHYSIFAPTTTGVEGDFSRAKAILGESRLNGSEAMESDTLKLVIDRNPAEEDEVIGLAREVWAATYGRCRDSHVQPRCDTGVPKRQAHNARTKTAFLKRRRAASDALINTTSTCNAESSIANVKTALGWNWTDSHQREKLFANNKEANKKLEAYRDGALLPSEIDAALVARSEVDEARDKNKSVGLVHIQKRILF